MHASIGLLVAIALALPRRRSQGSFLAALSALVRSTGPAAGLGVPVAGPAL